MAALDTLQWPAATNEVKSESGRHNQKASGSQRPHAAMLILRVRNEMNMRQLLTAGGTWAGNPLKWTTGSW